MIDDDHVERRLLRVKAQAQLFLESCEKARAFRPVGRWILCRREVQCDSVKAVEARSVDHRSARLVRYAARFGMVMLPRT